MINEHTLNRIEFLMKSNTFLRKLFILFCVWLYIFVGVFLQSQSVHTRLMHNINILKYCDVNVETLFACFRAYNSVIKTLPCILHFVCYVCATIIQKRTHNIGTIHKLREHQIRNFRPPLPHRTPKRMDKIWKRTLLTDEHPPLP